MLDTSKTLRGLVLAAMIIGGFGASAFAQVKPNVEGIFATVNLSYVAQSSRFGKTASMRIFVVRKAKEAEAAAKAAELQKQQVELQQPTGGMSERARADLEKAFTKSRLDFDRFRQDTEAELQEMQARFESDLMVKLAPVVDAISKEKGFHFVFGLEQSTLIVWANPALDISEEVVKRLDATPEK